MDDIFKWYKKNCFLIYNLYNFINNKDSIDIFMIIHDTFLYYPSNIRRINFEKFVWNFV